MYKFNVKVKPASKNIKVVSVNGHNFTVKFTSTATKNQANQQLIEVLTDYFKTRPSRIIIRSCEMSKKKVILVLDKND